MNHKRLIELTKIIEKSPDGTDITEILQKLDLPNDRTTTFQVAGAIRLMGFDIVKKGKWEAVTDPKTGKTSKKTVSYSVLDKS